MARDADSNMQWEEGLNMTSNWRELMLRALKRGHLTTIITFNDTKYLITMQPYETEESIPTKALCHVCGQIVLQQPGETRWYHENPVDGNHAAKVQGWVPRDPNKSWQHATCICGANLTWFVGPQRWEHTRGKAVGHTPIPTTAPPVAAADIPVVGKPLEVGQTAACSQCGEQLIYNGKFWEHVHGQLRHPAIPIDGSSYC